MKKIRDLENKNENTVNWRDLLRRSITTAEALARHLSIDPITVSEVANCYPFRINPYYLSLIHHPKDPIWRQAIPDAAEIEDTMGMPDPLAEEVLSPVPNLIHRYPDRVVLLVSNQCAMYCRFCMRKRRVGPSQSISLEETMEAAADYIRKEPRVREVILSGGDPFLLETGTVEKILITLRSIPHVEIIRIHSRTPCTLPQRITPALTDMLKKYQPLYVNTHFNHPLEITPIAAAACARLADAGIPLGNQTVFLKGVNDSAEVMRELFQKLLQIRVRPYYLHHPDPVRGTGHFRPSVEKGIEIMAAIQGHTSGICLPHYMIDMPGGGGKVPLLPAYIRGREAGKLIVRTYSGKTYEYPVA
ncbi:MAG: KamA family radical SAM protein [Pseudomonadota bacterium]